MRLTWREHVEALDEFRVAAKWYETKRVGLGDVFIDAVDAAIETILDSSMKWGYYRDRKRTPQIYSRSVAGFPFDIIYLLINGEVYIIAYVHERRRPGYWMHRLAD